MLQVELAGPQPNPALENAASTASDDASRAESSASDAAERARAIRERNTRRAQEAVDDVRREDQATAAAVRAAAAQAPLAGVAAGTPTAANAFASVSLSGLSVDQWREIA